MGAAPAEAFLIYGARAAFLLFLVWGLYNPLRALLMSRTVGVRVTRGLPAALVRRGIISSHDTSNQDALASLIAIVTPWEIRSRIGSGIGSLIGILLGSLFALPLFLDPGTFSSDAPRLQFALAMAYVLQTVGERTGATIGQLRSASRMDLVPKRSTGYSRSLSGRTSDFRASFLLTAPLALWLLTTACGVFALLGFIQPYFRWDTLTPYERSLLLLPILASALALLTFEVLAHMKSGARQRVYTFQTTISREADMYLRAVTVGHLYRSQFNVAATMLAFEWFILVLIGPPLANAQSLELFLAIVVISAFLLRFVNRRLTSLEGKLGGRLTGWPWQRRATPQVAG